MMNKKSQAALEFIMTYGWAILVVLVAIGALAYFGVLSPDKFLPSKCTLQSGIACIDHKVQGISTLTPNGRVTVVLKNGLGFDLTNVIAKAGNCGESLPKIMPNGADAATFTIDCGASNQILGSKFNNQLNVTYTITETGVDHNNVGQITSRVE